MHASTNHCKGPASTLHAMFTDKFIISTGELSSPKDMPAINLEVSSNG